MQHPWLTSVRDDIYGGLVSAAVAIPLAMGFGMFAFSSLGESYFADGALAGLVTAFVVGIVCILLGDKTTTVFAPRVNTTFFLGLLLYGLIHTDMEIMKDGGAPLALAVLFSVILLGGVLQTLFGLVGVGTLIRFAPYPVMAGFQNAAAILLFLVQAANICGFDHNMPFTHVPENMMSAKPLSIAIAVVTFLTMWNIKKFVPKVPPLLIALAVGIGLYYAFDIAGYGAYLGPVIAEQPRTPMGLTSFPYFADLARSHNLLALAPTIIGGALALAIIASIDALLCAKLVTPPGGKRVDGNLLLTRLGIGNVAAACIGGITSGINIGASVTNRTFGARTPLAVLVNSAAVLFASTVLFKIGGQMPRVALSAVIMVIAVQHIDPWSIQLVKRCIKGPSSYRSTHLLELFVVVLVAVLSIVLNIVSAVFIGVAIAVALFVVRMSRSTIRRSYRCNTVHSRRSRIHERAEFLERRGGTILVLELQGALFFGTGETLLKEIEGALAVETRCIILDTRRVSEIDSTGAQTLLEVYADLARRKVTLLITATEGTRAIERLREFGILEAIGSAQVFPDVDRTIERAENDLITAEMPGADPGTEIAPEALGLFARFDAADLATIKPFLTRVEFETSHEIYCEGESGRELLMIAKGTASAFLKSATGNIRLATFGRGTIFGELALLDEGLRAATVIADEPLTGYALTTENFAALSEKSPPVAIKLLAALGRELSGRLRTANRTIYQLES
jgi:MFS superfamily sulfate permease-like transporter